MPGRPTGWCCCSGSVAEVVELALGAVVAVPGLIGRAHPTVARDRAQVDIDAEQHAVPLGQHALETALIGVVVVDR